MQLKKKPVTSIQIQESQEECFNKKNVMFVGAHPDDIDCLAGGLLHNLALKGWNIRTVILTSGEKGTVDLNITVHDLVQTRQKEQKEALRLLGCDDILFANFEDRNLARDREKAREWLTGEIRRYKPEMLVSFDPWKKYELHPDHVACGHLTLDCRGCAKFPKMYPEQIKQGLTPAVVPTIMLFCPENPNYHEDISKSLEKKLQAALVHKSQFGEFEEEIINKIKMDAKNHGEKADLKYSEPYHRIEFDDVQLRQKPITHNPK